ncbi:D-amino-acid dehydrogenase [Tistlia consotensis]|uniref:D-amino-acid dehydrogenase n=1 Tax=Tistlia consotensis USBA 355 TaxID=560819 RepID=A0A1Y6CNB6_9PROT|nr:FAD-dependent oxidoreductase [Tistlia consotensis]SMF64147.1 D-amino-acid dehydrogenase [Tistlia consotensis USBA 355]SNR97844.1 D-amino-acid dehydrogenase [Tistlia consotensis]
MPDVIVLGAGMAGVGAALQLQRRGWSVALVDRRPPGTETSYGNAGIIQSECVEPYALPRSLPTLLAIALGRSNDVHYHLRALPSYVAPLLAYWQHSAPASHAEISRAYAPLIRRAAEEHAPLIAAAGAEALVRREGFRILFRSPKLMERAATDALRIRRDYGVAVEILAPDALAAAEPALTQGGAGGLHWSEPWTVRDPGALVGAYARLLVESGATWAEGDARSLRSGPNGGWQVETEQGRLEAGAAVVALGPWSPALLKRFGYRIPMIRKRGYHRHYHAAAGSNAGLDLPLLDEEYGYVMAPMARGLRITTGAELALPDAPPTPVQLRRAEQAAGELLTLGAPVEPEPWLGNRPCMPDMLPLVGRAPHHPGLWLHFGHGHQGFTLGPTTGRLLAELMSGETPFADPAPFRAERFG